MKIKTTKKITDKNMSTKKDNCKKAIMVGTRKIDDGTLIETKRLPISDLFALAYLVETGYKSISLLTDKKITAKKAKQVLKEATPSYKRFMEFVQCVDADLKRCEHEDDRKQKQSDNLNKTKKVNKRK